MMKRIIFVCLVAVIAYYAGTQELTTVNVIDWFTDNDILETLKEKFNEIFDLAEEQKVADKAGNFIDNLKETVSN